MIRKLKSGEYRLYSRKKIPKPASAAIWARSRRARLQRSTRERFSSSSAHDPQVAEAGAACVLRSAGALPQVARAEPRDRTASCSSDSTSAIRVSESMTWPESVAEALCFGWIDGVRRRIDERSYTIRFTPRKSSSIWSTVNTNKMHELIAAKRVHPAGMRACERRQAAKSSVYAYENRHTAVLDSDSERGLLRGGARHPLAHRFRRSPPATSSSRIG